MNLIVGISLIVSFQSRCRDLVDGNSLGDRLTEVYDEKFQSRCRDLVDGNRLPTLPADERKQFQSRCRDLVDGNPVLLYRIRADFPGFSPVAGI